LKAGQTINSVLPWLCRVGRHAAKDMAKSSFRRNGTHPPETMHDVAAKEAALEETVEPPEDAARLQEGLAALSAHDRELLLLHRDLTISKIAAKTGMTVRRVKRRLAKARAALRSLLQEYSPPCRQRRRKQSH
jgi:RNA polymerase sigma-70 factor (ECF subfamily)